MSYTAELFVDSTGENLGKYRFGSAPEVDRRVVIDGKEYIIVGTSSYVHTDAEVDYEVRLMPDYYPD